eukprot:gene15241-6448_t
MDDDSSPSLGQDLTKGREGGTWLGMSRNGKVGMLTNYRSKADHLQKNASGVLKPRGQIVVNYLTENRHPQSYVHELMASEKEYSPYNILLGNFTKNSGFNFYYGSNAVKMTEKDFELEPGVHGLSNAELNCSWTKVQKGKKKFEEIVSNDFEKEELIQKLLELMENGEINYPNHGGSDLHLDEEIAVPLSAIFVSVPKTMYGTRTITIILVDNENQVTFLEKTMMDAMDISNPKWQTKSYEFTLS